MIWKLAVVLSIAALTTPPLGAVSVLSHEELIDVTWQSDIVPLLLARYPQTSPEELKRAHSFAYGGSVIQDVGYYPLGNHFFTDLLHYVRSGDFIVALLREARNVHEYAFALGALSHYSADTLGHASVNLAEPILYAKLHRKYGDWVTYEEDHEAHLKTEFSFDVLEVAKHRYNSQQYHDFIGFEVSEDQLERAFRDNYGIPMDDLLHYDDLTLATFRFSVAKVVPEMTQVALATNRPRVSHERSDVAKQQFVYHLSRADYEKEYGNKYRRPGFFARILGFLIKILPLGPAKILGYHNPSALAEDFYFRSMDAAIDEYRGLLRQVKNGRLELPNRNFDTGNLTKAGEYMLCDRTYAELVQHLAKARDLSPDLRTNVLTFFQGGRPANDSIHPKDWKKVESALLVVRNLPATATSGVDAENRK
jgi:Zinc dependent phospholipase C